MREPLPVMLVPGLCAPRGSMPNRLRRSGGSGRSRSPTIAATTPWRRSRAAFSIPRRRGSPSPGSPWAATSRCRSCGWRRNGSSGSPCSIPSARPDTPQQSERRRALIALAQGGRFAEVVDLLWPIFVHRDRHGDAELHGIVRTMADETGAEAFVRQQHAIMTRPDARPMLGSIKCPTLVLVGDGDELTPPSSRRRSPRASPARAWSRCRTAATCRPSNGRMRSTARSPSGSDA